MTFRARLLQAGWLDEHEKLFERAMIGQGLLTAHFAYNPNFDDPTPFRFVSIQYDFTDPAPIPEPATLLLVGSGVAGIAMRCCRRRLRPSTAGSGAHV